MSAKKSNVEVRQEKRDLCVPWKPKDPELAELLETVAAEGKAVDRMNTAMKPHRDKLKEAQDRLIKGRETPVECEIEFDFDGNMVTVTRLDTSEIIESREMTDKDRELNMFPAAKQD